MHFGRYFRTTALFSLLGTHFNCSVDVDLQGVFFPPLGKQNNSLSVNPFLELIDLSFLVVNKSLNLEHLKSVLHCIAALWPRSVLLVPVDLADFCESESDC